MKAVVTGGGGFLGRAICERLCERGDEVVSISRGRYPELEQLGVVSVQGDLAQPDVDLRCFTGADVVFHVAAKPGVWGPRKEYVAVHEDGTRRVIEACRSHGVPRLVHTSSPSVCFDGSDHVAASNDLPYPTRFLAHYPETKARAEQAALAANDERLSTCALRPHLVFGPRDPNLLPRLVERAAEGKLAIVGEGTNEVSMTYIDNAAAAHLAAAENLGPEAPHAGRAYFIGQEEPVQLWKWIAELLEALGLPPVRRRLSLRAAYGIGATLEMVHRAFGLRAEPRMTRFVATQLATSHSYDMEPARRDFGYREEVSMAEATERTLRWLRERRA